MPPQASSSTGDSHHQPPLLLGVDGGGTKTLAWLATRSGASVTNMIGRGLAGPSNPQAAGCAVAQRNIRAAIDRAFSSAQLTPTPVAAACLALAGVGRQQIRQEMLDWANAIPLADQIQVVHDAQAVLAIGTDDGTGVAAICGTGSFAYGTAASEAHARSGGWGYLFGDEGSGYAIGCAALKAVARAADGRGSPTRLTNRLLEQLHLTEPSHLIPAIYGASSPRFAIAELTPCVFQAADDGDDTAVRILQEAAAELAHLIESVTRRLGLEHGHYDLALAGGVPVRQPTWAESIVESLRNLQSAPRRCSIVKDPVAGAVRLANRAFQS